MLSYSNFLILSLFALSCQANIIGVLLIRVKLSFDFYPIHHLALMFTLFTIFTYDMLMY